MSSGSVLRLPVKFLTHKPETIVAIIASSSRFVRGSIVPEMNILKENDDFISSDQHQKGTWKTLTKDDVDLKLNCFASLSDTLQFSPSMFVPRGATQLQFCQQILTPLIDKYRYFTKTLKHFETDMQDPWMLLSLFRAVRSLESVSLGSLLNGYYFTYLKQLPLRRLEFRDGHHSPHASNNISSSLDDLSANDSIIKNTLEEFRCFDPLEQLNFLASFTNLKVLDCFYPFGAPLDIFPIHSLVKLEHLRLDSNSLTIISSENSLFECVEDCLAELTELRFLSIPNHKLSSLSFLENLTCLNCLEIQFDFQMYVDDEEKLVQEMVFIQNLNAKNLREFKFGDSNYTNENGWNIILKVIADMKNLQVLELYFATFSLAGIALLHELSSSSSSSSSTSSIDDTSSSSCSSPLRKLRLHRPVFVGTGSNIIDLLSKFNDLEELTIAGEQDFSFSSQHSIFNSSFLPSSRLKNLVVDHLPKLNEWLFMKNKKYNQEEEIKTMNSKQQQFRQNSSPFLPKLKCLFLSGRVNKYFFEEFLFRLGATHSSSSSTLEVLEFYKGVFSFSSGWMKYILPFRNLKELYFYHCKDERSAENVDWKSEFMLLQDAAFDDLRNFQCFNPAFAFHVNDEVLKIISSTKFQYLRELSIAGKFSTTGFCYHLFKLKNLGRLHLHKGFLFLDELMESEPEHLVESKFPHLDEIFFSSD